MPTRAIVFLCSLAICLALGSGLKAAEIKEPDVRVLSELKTKQIDGAKNIAEAILRDRPDAVAAILLEVYTTDFLTHLNVATALKLTRKLTSAVTTHLINKGDVTLRLLDNKAGKRFIAKQDKHVRRLIAALPGDAGDFEKLGPAVILKISEYLNYCDLASWAKTCQFLHILLKGKKVERAADLLNYWSTKNIIAIPLKGHTDQVKSVAFSPVKQRLASASDDKTVRLWDMPTGVVQANLPGHAEAEVVAFSPDGTMLASGYKDGTIMVWGSESRLLIGHKEAVTSLAFAPNGGQLASGSLDDTVRLWDVKTGVEKLQKTIPDPKMIAFFPDGKIIAVLAANRIVLWNRITGELNNIFLSNADYFALAFSYDIKEFASGTLDGGIRVKAVQTGDTIASLNGRYYNSPIETSISLAFSPDGKLLASGTPDCIRIWNLKTRRSIMLFSQGKSATALSFYRDGKILAAGYKDGTMLLWKSGE